MIPNLVGMIDIRNKGLLVYPHSIGQNQMKTSRIHALAAPSAQLPSVTATSHLSSFQLGVLGIVVG